MKVASWKFKGVADNQFLTKTEAEKSMELEYYGFYEQVSMENYLNCNFSSDFDESNKTKEKQNKKTFRLFCQK